MKALKIILIIVGAIIALFFVITLLLPSEAHLERSTVINSPANAPFELVNSMKNWEKWSPWNEIDPNAVWQYSNIPAGVGSSQKWDSKNNQLGNGEIEIIESTPNTSIKTKLSFYGNEFGQGTWTFAEKDGKTTVTWAMHAKMGFLERWFALGMNPMLGPKFEKSLAKIKQISENPVKNLAISEVDVTATKYAVIHGNLDLKTDKISDTLGFIYKTVGEFIAKNKLTCTGAPIAITNVFDEKNMKWEYLAGFPVDKSFKGEGRIESVELPASKAVKCVNFGPYEKMQDAYKQVFEYIAKNNMEASGKPWEVYANDPMKVKPEEIQTDIYIPVKKK